MILKHGSKSNSKQAVRAYRLLMGFALGDDYSIALQTATKNFQREKGLKVDGIAGPQTFAALVATLPDVMYMDYSISVYVRAVQALVSCTIDGKYGKNTRANVIAFQATAQLEQTGNITRNDWLALWGCDYDKTARPIGTGTEQPVDYKQGDPQWGKVVYTSCGNKSQTIANSGCGPTSMADIQATWVDQTITPVEMCKYAVDHGFRTPANGTAWAFFKSIASAFGYTGFVQTKSMATARAAIKNGAFVVASMGPGYWTSGGHYICLWKTDDTYMYANDPASKTRKKQKLAAFENERKQFFIFYKPLDKADPAPTEETKQAEATAAPVTQAGGTQIIDISKWQGNIDFDKLKSKVAFVIARAGVGSDPDPKFDEYAQAMQARGIPFGVYCYSYAGTEAKARDEAKKLVSRASKYNPLFYVMDAEEEKITAAAIRVFAKELRAQGADRIGCYVANHRYKQYGYDDLRELWNFTWIPKYVNYSFTYGTPAVTVQFSGSAPAYPCDLWQFTSSGKIDGISGNVDLNLITGTGKTLSWFLGGET